MLALCAGFALLVTSPAHAQEGDDLALLDDARAPAAYAAAWQSEAEHDDVLGIGGGGTREPTLLESLEGLLLGAGALAALLLPLALISLAMRRKVEERIELKLQGGTHPRYDGEADALFRIYLQNVVLTLLTFGVYRFWAKVRATRFHHQHVTFAGARLDYLATGKEKFIGFLKGLVLLVPLAVGLYFEHEYLVARYGPELAYYGTAATFFVAMFALRPLILVGSQQFNLARTTWSNIRFRFDGKLGPAYGLYARDAALIVVTLGLYTPFHLVNVRRFKMRHTAIGDLRFDFRGRGGELFWLDIFGVPLCYLSLGLLTPWYVASRHRFWVTNTTLDGRRFHSRVTPGMVFVTGAPAMLAVVLTLGLALPWAITRWRRMVTHTTHYTGTVDPARIEALQGARSSATAEGLGEAGELLGGLGDLFGV